MRSFSILEGYSAIPEDMFTSRRRHVYEVQMAYIAKSCFRFSKLQRL